MSRATVKKSKAEIKAGRSFKEVIGDALEAKKGLRGIQKTSTTVYKGVTGESTEKLVDESGQLLVNPGVQYPTSEELAVINQYTRSPKQAEELAVFSTLSANTLPDRDDDYFDKETIQGFQELAAPYGPNGKSFMVGHDYSKLPVGRIFDTSGASAYGADFLTNKVYVPNTEQYKDFLENQDFGINWAVSVGVMLDAQLCSICKANQYSFFGMGICDTGHWKGDYYDPAETETDGWGDIKPTTPDDPKAVKCLGIMHGAQDFYELSQVFLGAQFHAALESPVSAGSKAVKGLARIKAAMAPNVFTNKSLHLVNLSADEAEELPLPHADPRVAEAYARYKVVSQADGSLKWVDDNDLVWEYTPGDPVMCLGKKSAESEKEESDGEGTASGQEPGEQPEEGDPGEGGDDSGEQGTESDRPGDDDPGHEDPGESDQHPGEVGSDGDLTEGPDDSNDPDDTEKGAQAVIDKKTVLAAAQAAGCSAELIKAVQGANGNGLSTLLRSLNTTATTLHAELSELRPKAAMGDKYLESKKADCLAAYVRMHAGGTGGVDTSSVESMLKAFGDNVELIDNLTAQYQSNFKERLPGPALRSSAPTDPNARPEPVTPPPAHNGHEVTSPKRRMTTVSRIHG